LGFAGPAWNGADQKLDYLGAGYHAEKREVGPRRAHVANWSLMDFRMIASRNVFKN
jgi:hypothetical protein